MYTTTPKSGLTWKRRIPYLWSMYVIAFAPDSTASTRSVGTPKKIGYLGVLANITAKTELTPSGQPEKATRNIYRLSEIIEAVVERD